MKSPKSLELDRHEFMTRVRTALSRARTEAPKDPIPRVDDSIARLATDDDDLVSLFATQADAVGMNVHRLRSAVLIERILTLLDQLNAKRVVMSLNPQSWPEHEVKLRDSLVRAGVNLVAGQDVPHLSEQFEFEVGITDVHAALAETGTMICCTDASHSRGVSLIPPTHLAIVRASDILPDMIDYWAQLEGVLPIDLPSSQTFITGPSKTSDIEGVLVTGVHGPGTVHILLVEDA